MLLEEIKENKEIIEQKLMPLNKKKKNKRKIK